MKEKEGTGWIKGLGESVAYLGAFLLAVYFLASVSGTPQNELELTRNSGLVTAGLGAIIWLAGSKVNLGEVTISE